MKGTPEGKNCPATEGSPERSEGHHRKRILNMPNWILYIVKCKDGSLYTGITTDLEKRIKRHNEGRATKYTRARKPVKLIYNETCASESEARKREIEVKRFSRARKLELVDR